MPNPALTPLLLWLQSVVDIARLGANLQYGRVPASLVSPVVSGLLGLLHIRCRCAPWQWHCLLLHTTASAVC
jgi:hypothetical protein